MDPNKSGSGTYAVDTYRQSKGDEAMNVLLAGHAQLAVSGTHASAGELCIEVIARIKGDNTHCVSDSAKVKTNNDAINNLRKGWGHHKAQADHGGGNTCVAVIAAATS